MRAGTTARRAAALALGLGSPAGFAATAEASVVSMTRTDVAAMSANIPKAPDFVAAHTDYTLSILARAGETNAITVRRDADAFVVRDTARASAGEGCVAADLFTVRCPTPLGPRAAFVRRSVGGVELGDGSDSFHAPTDLEGGAQQGTVDAGTGADAVTGAANALGGPGEDRLAATAADGGDGDDRVQAIDGEGGAGRDVLSALVPGASARLRGGGGDDVLDGGAAGDTLDGGAGADRLTAAAGDDVLRPGPGADAIDGGDGRDTASFAYAATAVRADLAQAQPLDPTGEGDRLAGVESLEGGAGDDALRGDDGANDLSGGGGRDEIEGRGGRDRVGGGEDDDDLSGGDGDDVLVGGRGGDRLRGGAGADDLAADDAAANDEDRGFLSSTADGARDSVTGEAGNDVLVVSGRDRADAGSGDDVLDARGRPRALACGSGRRDAVDAVVLVPRDCEHVRVLAFGDTISTRLVLRGGAVSVRVPSFLGPEEPTRVTIVLRVGGRLVGRGHRVVPDGAARFVRIGIGRSGRRLLRTSAAVRLVLMASDSTSTERDVVVLRAPR